MWTLGRKSRRDGIPTAADPRHLCAELTQYCFRNQCIDIIVFGKQDPIAEERTWGNGGIGRESQRVFVSRWHVHRWQQCLELKFGAHADDAFNRHLSSHYLREFP